MPYLTQEQGGNVVAVIPAGRPFTIGRGTGSALRIKDLKMSRVHCELSASGAVTVITDLGSMNGTWVNGKRVASVSLNDGDLIQVGYARLRYHAGGPAAFAGRVPAPAAAQAAPQPKGGAPHPPAPPARPRKAAGEERIEFAEAIQPPAARPAEEGVLVLEPISAEGQPPAAEAGKVASGTMDFPGLVTRHWIVQEVPARPPRRGDAACSSCRQPVAAKEVKTGAATNVRGQVCCPKCRESDPLLGKTIAGYRIDAKLGTGPWSVTYKAEQLSMARAVVLRVLGGEQALDSEMTAKFLAAVKRGGQISHPNLVRVYDIGRSEKMCFVSAEYVDGENLKHRVAAGKPFPPLDAVQIVGEVGGAVDVAHRRGVVHRDIRPANIILNDEWIPKLIGLGFCASIEEAAAAGLIKAAHPAEVVACWAPECLYTPEKVGKAADIYSLAAVAYTMLAGQLPFDPADPAELVRAICTVRPKPLDTVRKDVSKRLAGVIAKAMAKDPADRHADCHQFVEALRSAATAR